MTTGLGGYMGNVLYIDLTHRTTKKYPWSDQDRQLYLGGKIMAAKIIFDNIKTKIDAFSPNNLLVITTGPLTGTGAPSSSRFNISTISPLTGFLASSNCGGSFGIHLKKAGYDGLIITGRSEEPVWIEIKEDTVLFHDAHNLWGKDTEETQKILGGRTGKMVIGPAGENMVRYAAIISDERAAGRAGVGAVMGSKMLKAIVATGAKVVPVYDEAKKKEVYTKWRQAIRTHPLTGEQLPKLGTAGLISIMNARNMLATRNYKFGQFKNYDAISGETLAEKHLIKNRGCITCPIQCGRVVEVDGKQVKGPELETLGILGANIENSDLNLILRWNYLLDLLGMDTISTGSTIAFAMELEEKGLWKNGLKFGDCQDLDKVLEKIARREGIGNLLAEGSKRLSEKFGGKEFAIHSKGLELAAYEPRGAVGQGLGYATANRGGCHLNGGYLVILEGLGLNMDPHAIKAKAELNVLFQNLMEAVSACGSCLFTTYTLLPAFIIKKPNDLLSRIFNKSLVHMGGVVNLINKLPGKMLPFNPSALIYIDALRAVTGIKMTFGTFKDIGDRGYNLERLFNIRVQGLSKGDDSLPKRLTNTSQEEDNPKTKVPLSIMKKKYYKARGWDEEGIPKYGTLARLGLDGVGKNDCGPILWLDKTKAKKRKNDIDC